MTSGVIAGHRTRLHSVTPINQGSPHVESTARSHRCLRLIHGPDPTCAHGGWLFRHPRAPLQELGGCAGSCRFCDRVPARDGGEESSLGWGEDSIRTFERPSGWSTMFCPTRNTPAPRFHSNGKIWTIPEDPSPNTSLSGRSRPGTRPVSPGRRNTTNGAGEQELTERARPAATCRLCSAPIDFTLAGRLSRGVQLRQ